MKLFERVLESRMRARLELLGMIPDAQNGFRQDRGTHMPVFVLRELLLQRARHDLPGCVALIDLKKAYDLVWRDALWVKLHDIGIRGKMWTMVRNLCQGVQTRVRTGVNEFSDWFENGKGVRQGSVLSPLLFIIYMADFIEQIEKLGVGYFVNVTSGGRVNPLDARSCVTNH